ncbi:hypothetical protein ACFWDI_26580 [Streptomyces sp. NPDC060064]|uniref:hypothetical protein n=1 Tax=Streptomyces sp. NPDC060064 TaxID=3347049 RepID=UPI00368E27BF
MKCPGGFELAVRDGVSHESGEVVEGVLADVAVRVGGLQIAADEVVVDALLLEVGGESADQEIGVGQGIGERVQHQPPHSPGKSA